MDFRQFRSFVTVADEQHVGRAAGKLGITQPTLSLQIQQLELQLGVALFSRERRKLVLTRAGTLFLEQARLALKQADHAVQVAKSAEREEVGQVTVGFVDAFGLGGKSCELINRFARARPEVELVFKAGAIDDQVIGVTDGKLDVSLVWGPIPTVPHGLSCDAIDEDELILCLPSHHRLASLARVPVAQLANETLLVPTEPAGIGLSGQTALIAHTAGFSPRLMPCGNQAAGLASLVACGLGVTILPASFKPLHLPQVVCRPLEEPLSITLHLLSRRQEHASTASELIQLCRGATLTSREGEAQEYRRLVA